MADGSSDSFLEWFVSFRNPAEIWQEEPTFLLCEILHLLYAILTFKHAVNHGGCYLFLWIAACLHGLTTEYVSYMVPDVDNFWHAQSMVMFIGKRLPLHIFLFYPGMLYTGSLAVSKLGLPLLVEPFALGLIDVILDFPFDIMGIKLLWWTWHDTDPNIFDRHYWVPWTSYIFHMSFAWSLAFLYHGSRKLLIGAEKYQPSNSWIKEFLCVLITGLFSMPLGVIQFIVFYHIPHDVYNIHTEVVVCVMIMVYALIVWSADRNPRHSEGRKQSLFDEISFIALVQFTFYIILVIFAKPENIRSTGLHQEIGNCSLETPVHTPIGQVLYKKTFLCSSNYDEGYYDYHCLPNSTPPPDGSSWYTLCGMPYPNHAEYILVVTAFCVLGLSVFHQLLFKSSTRKSSMAKEKKTN